MKNKYFVTVMGLIFLIAGVAVVTEAAQKPAAVAPVAAKTPEQLKAQVIQKAQQGLSLHEWAVYVTSTDAKGKAAIETDVLTFNNGKITSRNLLAQGYPESNYGLAVQDNGTAVWETMQARELPGEVDIAFIRGALFPNGVLSGTIIMQPQKGASKAFEYSTVKPQTTPAPTTTGTPQKGKR